MKRLTAKQIETFCARHGWHAVRNDSSIAKSYKTGAFLSGLAFVTQIAVAAESANHHPDVTLTYGSVKVVLSTHDANGVTKLDTVLAQKIDSYASKLLH